MPVSKYEIDAKADTVIVFKTPSPSFSPWSPAEVEGSMTTLDQGLASEDADQTISVKVAIVPDNERRRNLVLCFLAPPDINIIHNERTLREPGSTGRERGRTLLGARSPREKLQDREKTSIMRVAPELQQLLAAK
ncbi:hypothetical protein ACJQWK_11966 [Exserohilum turcicum]